MKCGECNREFEFAEPIIDCLELAVDFGFILSELDKKYYQGNLCTKCYKKLINQNSAQTTV